MNPWVYVHKMMVGLGIVLLGLAPLWASRGACESVHQDSSHGGQSDMASALQDVLEAYPSFQEGRNRFSIPFADLKTLYGRVGFKPLWFTDQALTTCVQPLLEALGHVRWEGLDQKDYDWALNLITQWRQMKPQNIQALLRADLLLSQALLQYISDLRGERLSPKKIDKELYMDKPHIDEVSLLVELLKKEEGGSCAWIQALPPQSAPYKKLKEALHDLLTIQGDSHRSSLVASVSEDEKMSQSKTKKPHGSSFKEKSLEEKIEQVIVTMERLRWMPEEWGDKYVLVNIPAFKVTAVEGGKQAFTMPIIVGKAYRETPVFTSEIINIIVNPSWNVPRMIAVSDELRSIKKEGPSFLTKRNIHVYRDGQEIDPHSIHWGSVTSENFDFHLRQDPGPLNALGRLRFTIPNPFSVYMHGTPKQKLFDEKKRTFSSGCIRLEDPNKMALFVLQDNGGDWTLAKIQSAISSNQTQTITLDHPVPVYLQYLTVVFNEAGEPEFLEDVYGQDKQIRQALLGRHAQGP